MKYWIIIIFKCTPPPPWDFPSLTFDLSSFRIRNQDVHIELLTVLKWWDGDACRLLFWDYDKAFNSQESILWPLRSRLSKDGYRGCHLVSNFKLHSILHAASSWVNSHLMNLLSPLTPLKLLLNLGPKTNRSSWKGGVVWEGGKVLSFLTTNSFKSWFLLNWKDPLFWMTGWRDVWLSDCLLSAGTSDRYRLTGPGNQNRHLQPAVVTWSKERRGLKYPTTVFLRMKV